MLKTKATKTFPVVDDGEGLRRLAVAAAAVHPRIGAAWAAQAAKADPIRGAPGALGSACRRPCGGTRAPPAAR